MIDLRNGNSRTTDYTDNIAGQDGRAVLRKTFPIRTTTGMNRRKLRRFFGVQTSSSSPHDAGVGSGGDERGIPKSSSVSRRASSPRPSPPSDGGEGVLVAALAALGNSWSQLLFF